MKRLYGYTDEDGEIYAADAENGKFLLRIVKCGNGLEAALFCCRATDQKGRKYRQSFTVEVSNGEEVICEFVVEEYYDDFTSFYFQCVYGWENNEPGWDEDGGLFDREFTAIITQEREEEVVAYNVLTAKEAEEAWEKLTAMEWEWSDLSEYEKKLEGVMADLGLFCEDIFPCTISEAIEYLKTHGV